MMLSTTASDARVARLVRCAISRAPLGGLGAEGHALAVEPAERAVVALAPPAAARRLEQDRRALAFIEVEPASHCSKNGS